MVITHSTAHIPGNIVASADWNANHVGTATPTAHTLASHSTKAHAELTNVTSDLHHPQSHNAASHSDIASTGAQIDGAVAASHAIMTLNASATNGGMSLIGQDISNRAATNAQTGYMTAALVGNIETNNAKNTNVTTNLSLGAIDGTTMVIACSDGTDATLIEADTNDAGLLGANKWDEIVANSLKTSYTKTNVKGHVAHGAVGATARAAGFTSVEWVGSVEPANAVNGDTWIDTT